MPNKNLESEAREAYMLLCPEVEGWLRKPTILPRCVRPTERPALTDDGNNLLFARKVRAVKTLCEYHLQFFPDDLVREINTANAESSVHPMDDEKRKTQVYLMRNVRNGLTKIGIPVDPKYREKTLQAEEPEVELLWSASGDALDERALHSRFSNRRVKGEWFNLTEDDIRRITREYAPAIS